MKSKELENELRTLYKRTKQQRNKRRRMHYIEMAAIYTAPREKHGQTVQVANKEL
jgi:hypothetical protein